MPRNKQTYVPCPHCNTQTRISKTDQITPLVRQVRYNCQNPDCGHVFQANVEVIKTLRKSFKPNPDIHLPISERAAVQNN